MCKKIPYILLILIAIILLLCLYMPESMAPDEDMRNDIPEWIFNRHELPIGNEPELTNNVWRFSYGFLPYLPSLIAVPLMHVFDLFSDSRSIIIIATRLISLLSFVGIYCTCVAISRRLFNSESELSLFIVSVLSIPQIVFLASYHNNDLPALFGCFLLFFSLIVGHENKWGIRDLTLFGMALVIISLTYYNALGFVACSLLYLLYDFAKLSKTNPDEFNLNGCAKKIFCIFAIWMICAGWVFIRNAVIYNGDFLGIIAQKNCAGHLLSLGLPTHQPFSYSRNNVPLLSMLIDNNWIIISAKSFFATFGYMDIYCKNWCYTFYFVFFGGGLILGVHRFISKRLMIELLCLLISIVIPVLLSIYRSYTYDFQPQGRYLLPALPALAILSVLGWSGAAKFFCGLFDDNLYKKRGYEIIMNSLTIVYLTVSIYIIIFTLLPGVLGLHIITFH